MNAFWKLNRTGARLMSIFTGVVASLLILGRTWEQEPGFAGIIAWQIAMCITLWMTADWMGRKIKPPKTEAHSNDQASSRL